jgi:GTP diphosphokinase / guanosine-3',5'-bis(diphosphate) 3'-diphosphatase
MTPTRRILISDLCDRLAQNTTLSKKEIKLIYQAYLFAAHAHQFQTRHSGEPFIYHPLAVASILVDIKMDSDCIIAAILHDVVEDTKVSQKEIKKKFGKSVAILVDGVTKLTNIKFSSLKERQAANLHKLLIATVKDIRVVIIKIADRLHNMRTILAIKNNKKQREKVAETLDIYVPLANRLGLFNIKKELEDICFKTMYPKRYQTFSQAMSKIINKNKEILIRAQKTIKQSLYKKNISVVVQTHQRQIYSVYKKTKAKKTSIKNMTDILGIRLITNNIDDCYSALGVVHQEFTPIVGRFKDYIANPKINNYQSLHTNVFIPPGVAVEIQIRSTDMDKIAVQGIAAHWRHRRQKNLANAKLWLNDLKQIQYQDKDSLNFLQNVRSQMTEGEVFVFSPKGKTYTLPQGSCALDFAYAVHSDIGNRAIGCYINDLRKPLNYVLKNGQKVKILCDKKSKPQKLWLNFVKSGKARSAITFFLKKQDKKRFLFFGEFLLKRALNKKIDEKIPQNIIEHVMQKIGIKSKKELYLKTGTGDKNPQNMAKAIFANIKKNNKYKNKGDNNVITLDTDKNKFIYFCKRCQPVLGDMVQGFINHNKGLIVHRTECKNILYYQKQPQNWVDVSWDKTLKTQYPTKLHVTCQEKKGMLASITALIHKNDVHIQNIKFPPSDDIVRIMIFAIFINNVKHLNKLIKQISKIDGIHSVTRNFGD